MDRKSIVLAIINVNNIIYRHKIAVRKICS